MQLVSLKVNGMHQITLFRERSHYANHCQSWKLSHKAPVLFYLADDLHMLTKSTIRSSSDSFALPVSDSCLRRMSRELLIANHFVYQTQKLCIALLKGLYCVTHQPNRKQSPEIETRLFEHPRSRNRLKSRTVEL